MVTYIGDITEIESRIRCIIILFDAEHTCYSNVASRELHGDAETVRLRSSEM